MVISKGYGPYALILPPRVFKEGKFRSWCVDHASTYVTGQIERGKDIPEEEERIMKRYELTPPELVEFIAYTTASFKKKPPELYPRPIAEKIGFLTIDIGLPGIDKSDIEAIVFKTGQSSLSDDPYAQKFCAENDILYLIANPVPNVTYGQEHAIGKWIENYYHVPEQFQSLLKNIE